jgi:ABC-2 type transport system ATP-binding protein
VAQAAIRRWRNGYRFTVGDGEIVGLLGHNGAGKTTIMKLLTGFLEPSSGLVTKTERSEAKARIGYLLENCPVYPEMTVVAFLDYAAALHGVDAGRRPQALRDAIAATALTEKAADPIANLSRGYQQRVGAAQAILHRPNSTNPRTASIPRRSDICAS